MNAERLVNCWNTLSEIDNPERFIQDVRQYFEDKIQQGNHREMELITEIQAHLKGDTP